MHSVAGQTAQEAYDKRAAFTRNWALRPEFRTSYDPLTNDGYVHTLMNRYSLNSITTPDPANPEGASMVTLTSSELINRLNASGAQHLTRA
ncbi:MAG: hypothetical protein DMF64_15475 [Acidobacteria bacterium]|nr:MAG: hypothetical protein DMF64_15475 [Acidobacteriota bacterium]